MMKRDELIERVRCNVEFITGRGKSEESVKRMLDGYSESVGPGVSPLMGSLILLQLMELTDAVKSLHSKWY